MTEDRQTEWTYVVGDPPVERRAVLRPGYDCRVACKHMPQGNHGQHNDEIHLMVRSLPSGRYEEAEVLTLFTIRRDDAVHRFGYEKMQSAEAADITSHLSYVVDPSDVRVDAGTTMCHVLRAGGCYTAESSVSCARDIWTDADDAALAEFLMEPDVLTRMLTMQSGVWERLTARLLSTVKEKRAAHEALPKQCCACGGAGLVPRVRS